MDTDIITDVLRAVRLSGAIFFEVDASPPWVAEAPSAAQVAHVVMPGAQSVIEYHVVTSGACWAAVTGPAEKSEKPVHLEAGSVVMFPRGDPHVLSSAPGMRAPSDLRAYRRPSSEDPLPFGLRLGREPGTAKVICGFLGCDAKPFNPLIQALPGIVHVTGGYTSESGWLGSLIRATVEESRHRRVGSGCVLSKLSELIFVEVIRRYMESLPETASGWLTALRDPHVGRALRLMHQDPKRSWTLVDLSREVGVSRSILAERFSARVGVAPMTYLLNWRMQLAAGMLTDGSAGMSKIAAEVGYESEAAFSRAFKRCAGVAPGVWRSTGPLAAAQLASAGASPERMAAGATSRVS